MATIPSCVRLISRRWTAKRSISAAVVATLVLIAVTAITSISLAPANITFFIKQAEIVQYGLYYPNRTLARIYNTHLNFTLVARNKSPRTEVRYGPMDSEIWYGHTEGVWIRTSAFIVSAATTTTAGGEWHQPGTDACFSASANYGYSPTLNPPIDSLVVVKAKVWFRYGLATTLPFTVSVSCWHVNFVYRTTNFPVECA